MKILFITHETTRTGAPFVVLHLIQWLKEHHQLIEISVLSLRKGSLEAEFKNTADFYYDLTTLKPTKPTFLQKVIYKFFKTRPKIDLKLQLIEQLAAQQFDVIYANTVVSIPIGVAIKNQNRQSKLIAHIHELNTIIRLTLPNIENYINDISSFIAPSYLVKNNLVSNWNIPKENLHVVYEFSKNEGKDIKKITNRIFTIGASGFVHWRKGNDVFIQIARYIKTHFPDTQVQFVWVGNIPKIELEIIEYDLNQLQLKDVVKFVGEQENPITYYQDFDVFLMTSREDPFPLVCIEVGMLGKPIICFENATGTTEIIEKGGGFIVPYLSVEAMAEKIIFYYNNSEILQKHGEINKIAFSQFTPEIACPKLFNIIENTH